jgi:CBS domain-containing protein
MQRPVRDVMRRAFIQVAPDEGLEAVYRLMAMARVRELPVVEGGQVAGMVSHLDLARASLKCARRRDRAGLSGPIAPFVRPVEPLSPDATLQHAARRMLDDRRPCLPAVELTLGGGLPRIVGLLVEGDLLRIAYSQGAERA